jgi:ABC-type multidrug transport system fused ATPase/permease subunit
VLRRPPVLLLTRPPAARRGQQLFIALIDRVSTVTGADRILVIDAGRVRAIGSHAELAGTDDLYRRLATTQLLAAET